MNTSSIARIPVIAATALLAAVFALAIGSSPALAKDDINIAKMKTTVTYSFIYYAASQDADMDVWQLYTKSGKVTNVKSSNKAVATAKATKNKKKINLTLKKAGTTKLTFKCKGKSYNVKVVVAKYLKPVKSLKVGGTEYASSLQRRPLSTVPLTSGKLSVQANSGWKFVSASYYSNTTETVKKVANGKRVPKSADYLYVNMRHKKTGAIAILAMYPEG